ncbi:T1SS secreted agglutinin RTX [Photobacterium aphoticum]|uniref:T1SS secreted agglutinin RTX n=1 Tax=Photobacterium aphoticum TaxID=754436 RepID=A0A090QUZ0_9GAMM|nr:T1SS secreted agglutinin RTX [Photobacterium aphoticum]
MFANTTVQGQYGSLELVDGKWTYTLDQSKVQQLDEGDVVKDTITLTASDGTKQDIVIDITGTEDAPEVSGSFTGSVTEAISVTQIQKPQRQPAPLVSRISTTATIRCLPIPPCKANTAHWN